MQSPPISVEPHPRRPGLALACALLGWGAVLAASFAVVGLAASVALIWLFGAAGEEWSTTLGILYFIVLLATPLLLFAWWVLSFSRVFRLGGPALPKVVTRGRVAATLILAMGWMSVVCGTPLAIFIFVGPEETIWSAIHNSDKMRDFTEYLSRFPHGKHREEAEKRLTQLEKQDKELLTKLLSQVKFPDPKPSDDKQGPAFGPPYFIVDESGGMYKKITPGNGIRLSQLAPDVSSARTLIVCRDSFWGGKYFTLAGDETKGRGIVTTLSCCAIDVRDPSRLRTLAQSGELRLDENARDYDRIANEQVGELFPRLMERVASGKP